MSYCNLFHIFLLATADDNFGTIEAEASRDRQANAAHMRAIVEQEAQQSMQLPSSGTGDDCHFIRQMSRHSRSRHSFVSSFDGLCYRTAIVLLWAQRGQSTHTVCLSALCTRGRAPIAVQMFRLLTRTRFIAIVDKQNSRDMRRIVIESTYHRTVIRGFVAMSNAGGIALHEAE